MALTKMYTIRQIAAELGTTLRAIRFYEERQLVRPLRGGVTKGPATRAYNEEHRQRVAEILMLRRAGFTIREIAGTISPKSYAHKLESALRQRAQLNETIDLLRARAKEVPDEQSPPGA